jgi:histo-blood group ABO system transferase
MFDKKLLALCAFFSVLSFSQDSIINKPLKIGLLVVATGKYIQFVEPLVKSGNNYFCPTHQVTYFVFTDGQAPKADNIVSIYQKRLGWPFDTMMRFSMYAQQKELLQNMDYLFACDADMLFVESVGDEILGDLVGTLHPGYVGNKGTYETRPQSTAYISPHEGTCYFAGGFYGGKTENVLAMAETITNNIKKDLEKNIVAVWHDESHLNRYFVDHKPTIVLNPSYCWPEYPPEQHVVGAWTKYPPKLMALYKKTNLR